MFGCFIVFNLFVAVILDNMASLDDDEEHPLGPQAFSYAWERFDPFSHYLLPVGEIEALLYWIGRPLGFSPIIRRSERLRFFLSLNVPTRAGLVQYSDMYEHLSRRCLKIAHLEDSTDPLQTLPVSDQIISILERKRKDERNTATRARRSARVRAMHLSDKVDCTIDMGVGVVPFKKAYAAVMIIDWYIRCKGLNKWIVGCQVRHADGLLGRGVLEDVRLGTHKPWGVRFFLTSRVEWFNLESVHKLLMLTKRELEAERDVEAARHNGAGLSRTPNSKLGLTNSKPGATSAGMQAALGATGPQTALDTAAGRQGKAITNMAITNMP